MCTEKYCSMFVVPNVKNKTKKSLPGKSPPSSLMLFSTSYSVSSLPSSCAAELEVGAKEKEFCTEIYFLWRICKKEKKKKKSNY